MAHKEDYSKMDGVWRTISGRRVFIKKGQSLTEAMRESGKFKENKRKTTKSGKYTYEYIKEQNPNLDYEDKAFVVYDEDGNEVYKRYYNSDNEENEKTILSNFEFNEEWNIKYYNEQIKRLKKITKENKFGNYRSTKEGRIMYDNALKIKEETGDVIKDIKIEKSNVSDSKYINMSIDTDKYPDMNETYTIRISDHKRPPYGVTGSFGGYEHHYDYEVILEGNKEVNWDYVVSEVIKDINWSK